MRQVLAYVLWLVRRVFILPVRLYQRIVSPILPPACRYTPTCSEYTVQAIERYGVVVGSLKGMRRLLRCHPWGGSGHDPLD